MNLQQTYFIQHNGISGGNRPFLSLLSGPRTQKKLRYPRYSSRKFFFVVQEDTVIFKKES